MEWTSIRCGSIIDIKNKIAPWIILKKRKKRKSTGIKSLYVVSLNRRQSTWIPFESALPLRTNSENPFDYSLRQKQQFEAASHGYVSEKGVDQYSLGWTRWPHSWRVYRYRSPQSYLLAFTCLPMVLFREIFEFLDLDVRVDEMFYITRLWKSYPFEVKIVKVFPLTCEVLVREVHETQKYLLSTSDLS